MALFIVFGAVIFPMTRFGVGLYYTSKSIEPLNLDRT